MLHIESKIGIIDKCHQDAQTYLNNLRHYNEILDKINNLESKEVHKDYAYIKLQKWGNIELTLTVENDNLRIIEGRFRKTYFIVYVQSMSTNDDYKTKVKFTGETDIPNILKLILSKNKLKNYLDIAVDWLEENV